MELGLIVAGLVLAGLVGWALFSLFGGPDDDATLRRFDKVPNFRVTEAHAFEGTGIAADEAECKVLVLGKDRKQMALMTVKDLIGWHYLPKDDGFTMEIRSRRHRDPFEVRFAKRGDADLWIKILTVMAKRK